MVSLFMSQSVYGSVCVMSMVVRYNHIISSTWCDLDIKGFGTLIFKKNFPDADVAASPPPTRTHAKARSSWRTGNQPSD